MDKQNITRAAKSFLKRWWASLLILPFIIYSLHQIYWAIQYNIFFAVNYDYPFPLNIVNFFVDNFLLITHEAGHTFFRIFGVRFITILGGSLFQIILPVVIFAYFWFNKKRIGMQFSLVLVGFSWLDVAGYAADGGARQLPLIGGLGKEAHDWYNLLVKMNALEHDITFALCFVAMGIICYLWALLIPLLPEQPKEVSIDLDLDT
ncbi:hypothetical protein [Fodinibius halophilus]|uniref:Uncharacterized protein n=1 Tax=Fodinibius halophilus TaxID=1736908 RepID=A0A6M1T3Z3_9BACT|nr:hypothetical protein [Fodinibius halophilus]NGP87945.1 hypothetical protein [Fodinibius halophilus]